MEFFQNLSAGFGVALSLSNFLYCLVGVTLGTFIGVLPGIGPMATIGMLLPITFYLNEVSALIMLAGIYYGAQYGGSITSILLRLPGTASSAVVTLDGYPMAQQGRAGAALFMTTFGSFIAGCGTIILISLFAPPLAKIALNFGAPEYFSLMVMALLAASVLAQGSVLNGVAMVLLGLLIGSMGADMGTGKLRYTFGIPELADGLSIVILAMALFGIVEIIANLGEKNQRKAYTTEIGWRSLLPKRKDIMTSLPAINRGFWIGSVLGILPGTGSLISSYMAYAVEKKWAKDPSRFGKGAIEGVVAPETANNAAAQTAFIPTLTLGLPGDAVMALMLGALMIHGIAPGPQVIQDHPMLFWGLIASFWIGNFLLLILNLPLIRIWIEVLSIPYRLLYPGIVLFICIGVYSLFNNPFHIILTAFLGIASFILVRLDCEGAPLLLGFVLSPLLEENLRRSLLLGRGDLGILIERPLSLAFLLIAFSLVLFPILRAILRKRRPYRS
jgi:TctA family transporter